MATSRTRVEIYSPVGFHATWSKFKEMCDRDGQSASELVRIWIERYVAVKDPSNPQKPLTAYDPTHIDYYNQGKEHIKGYLLGRAKKIDMTLKWSAIIWEFRDIPVIKTRIKRAEEMMRELTQEGVKVYR